MTYWLADLVSQFPPSNTREASQVLLSMLYLILGFWNVTFRCKLYGSNLLMKQFFLMRQAGNCILFFSSSEFTWLD